MNILLPLLLATQAATTPEPTAREFFEKVERRFLDAGKVALKGTVTAKRYKHEAEMNVTAEFKGGDSFVISAEGRYRKGKMSWSVTCEKGHVRTELFGDENIDIDMEGMDYGSDAYGGGADTRTDDEERAARVTIFRSGILLSYIRFPGGKHGWGTLPTAPKHIAFGDETRLGDRAVRVLSFETSIRDSPIFKHKLWVDAETLEILRRDAVSSDGATTTTENYGPAPAATTSK